jgi:hypothetical protein
MHYSFTGLLAASSTATTTRSSDLRAGHPASSSWSKMRCPKMGVAVWPIVEIEAKDLAQCVHGTRVVQMNRRTLSIRDEAGVLAKFGVPPDSIPDYLALVGDPADGYPGLPGWGAKSTAAILAKYGHLESIPADWRTWHVNAASAGALAGTLAQERDRAFRSQRSGVWWNPGKPRSDFPPFPPLESAPRFSHSHTRRFPSVVEYWMAGDLQPCRI